MNLFDRVKNGDLDYINEVEPDVLLKARDADGMSVLSIAAIHDQLDCCKEILKKCPSLLYHQNNFKNTVIHHATYYGFPGGIFRLVDFFVSFGLDAAKNESDVESDMERFKRWIKLQNHNADTGLTQAAYYKNHDIVRRFVEVDRQYNLGLSEMAGYKGKMALQIAVEYQDQVMIKLLTDGQDIDVDSLSFPVDLFDRVKSGDLDYIKTVPLDVLQNTRDDYQMSALSIATIQDDLDSCKEILRRCPSLLYHQNSMRNTVLHHATYYGIGGGIFRLIDFFVSFGLNVAKNEGDNDNGMARFKRWIKLQNHNADTGLTQAVYYRNHDIVRRFVEVDRQYKLGLTEVAGYKGKTALQLAVEYQDQVMIKLLTDGQDIDVDSLSFPVDLFDRVKSGDLDYIKTVPLDVLQNTRDDYQMSALSVATIEDQLDCCKEILRRCPSFLYHQNSMRNTVLHHATYYGIGGGIFRLIDFFVSFGLNVAKNEGDNENGMARFKRWIKLQNHNADTGLTQAVYYRNHDIVRRFVEVDRQYKLGLTEVAGYKGKTALQLAVEYQDQVMIKLLTDGQDIDVDSLSFPVDLFDRIKSGDLDYIKTVPLDVLQNTRDDYQMSALSVATIEDQLDCCKEILRRCPSFLYHQNSMRNTVLHHATYYGIGGGIFRLIDFFVSFGLNVAKNEGDNENGMARFKRWIKLQNHNADTGLTQAVYYRNHDIVRRFVEVDRQYKLGLTEVAGYKGKTALQLAVEYQDQVMIKLLTDGQDIDVDSLSFPVDLFDRIKSGDLDYIKTVPLDVLQNTRDDYQMSALSVATIEDQLDCCKEILRRCPSFLYHQNSMRNTVLHHATYYGIGGGIFRLIDFFVSFGLNVAKNEGDNENGMARFKRWIKLQNHNADTGLTQAVYYRNHDIVRRFVEVDRQYKLGLTEVAGYKGKTALQLAVEYQDQVMIKLLTDGQDIDVDSLSFPVDLFDRIKSGDLDYIKTVPLDVLQNTRDDYQMSALSVATIEDQLDCCKEILRRCPSFLYHQNSMRNTVLHHATYYRNGIFRLIDFFVSAGLNAAKNEGDIEEGMARFKRWMKLQNHNADTGLTQAVYYRNHDIVRRFVEVDRQYKLGLSEVAGYKRKTALQLATEIQDHEMINLLADGREPGLDYGPISNTNTSLSFAVDLLFDRVKSGDLDYIKTIPQDVLLNTRDEDGMSLLSTATINNQLECCSEILKRCPSLLYYQNNFKDTVLHHATYYGNGIFRLIDFFVSAGLDAATKEGDLESKEESMIRFTKWLKLQNHNADTALTQAAYYRNLHIVKRLVEVDRQYKLGLLEIAGYNRKTALHLAMEYDDHEMLKLLTDEGDPYSHYIPFSIALDLFDRVKYGDLDYIKTVRLDVLLNSRDGDRMSVLSIAAINDQLDCCKEIQKRCPSLLYHQNNFKNTVLHHATYYGRGIFRLIDFFVSVGLNVAKNEGDILPFKRWMSLQNNNADTALTQAAYYRNHDIVKRLVEVDYQYKLGLLEMAGHKRKTALQLALEYQDHEMIKMLTERQDPDANNFK